MTNFYVGAAVAALAIAVAPALAQTAPPTPPGVAQGTAPVPMQSPPRIERRQQMHMRMMGRDHVMTRDEVVRHVREIFARFDANRDGFVTREELEGFHRKFANMGADIHKRLEDHGVMMGDRRAIFDRLDSNHDGMISRQEFMAAAPQVRERRVMIIRDGNGPSDPGMHGLHGMEMPMNGMGMHRMGGGFGGHLFEMADANHDGRVSLQEAESAALQHFDRADRNHDGRITPDERRQAHEMMRRERHPG